MQVRVTGIRTLATCLLFLLTACSDKEPSSTAASESSRAGAPEPSAPPAATPSDPVPFQDLAAADILNLNQRWSGDYNDLEERRFLRVLVPFSRTLYYLDGPEQKGIAYESLRELEKVLPVIGNSKVRPKIVIIPTTRDRLLPALAEGYGDVAIGAFTITDRRRETVEFSVPTVSGIEDVVVTN
jgi:ABC-type amino acid transport substrate-binding protein